MDEKTKEIRESEHRSYGRRLSVLMILFCLLFGGLGYRAFDLQVRRSASFRQMVKVSQYLTLRLPAKRGDIFDRHMTPLAISVEVDSLFTNPRSVPNKAKLAAQLAPILNISKSKLLRKLLQDRYFVWIKRHVSRREMRAVRRLGLDKSVRVIQERKRFYPNHALASHLLGYTDRDGRGLSGVERFFDRLLRGKKRSIRLPHDPKGRHILDPRKLSFSGGTGASLVLTIDKTIQYATETALAKAVLENKAKSGSAVVMDPKNGDVLALAVYPTFDPNQFRDVPTRIRNNSAISNPYEPGSTMKLISIAVARHLRLFKKGEVMNCENGRMRIGRYTIRDDHPFKTLTPTGTMQHSSNICTAKLAMRVGKFRLYKYLRMFGFGQKTNLGLPWESRGILHRPKRWANISLANIAFGQGVSVTPLQLTAAVNALANGGVYYRPRLYRSIVDNKGRQIRALRPRRVQRVVSRFAARDILKMGEVVVQSGTGKNAQITGIRVGGKTGTAQKPRANGRGYGKGRIASFIGFLPVEKPRLTILVMVDEPKFSKYGGTVAAPAWKTIARTAMQHLGHLAGGKMQFRRFKKPVFAMNKLNVQKAQKAKSASVKVDGSPKKRPSQRSQNKTKKRTQAKTKSIPSFLGLSTQEALQRAKRYKIRLRMIGKGKARYQKPRAGSRFRRHVTVVFTSSS